MSRKMKCSYDGIGYVNNTGQSKYWGVSVKGDGWRVKSHTSFGNYDWLYAKFDMTEAEAAHIAASFYEKPVTTHGLGRMIMSKDATHKYVVSGLFGTITKEPLYLADYDKKHFHTVTGDVDNWGKEELSVVRGLQQISTEGQRDSRFYDTIIGIAQAAKQGITA